jgi:hypothetical protein
LSASKFLTYYSYLNSNFYFLEVDFQIKYFYMNWQLLILIFSLLKEQFEMYNSFSKFQFQQIFK